MKQDIERGKDPDPHGMAMYQGQINYCDAGISAGSVESKSPFAGYVYRIDL
jgi:hypothetical protein